MSIHATPAHAVWSDQSCFLNFSELASCSADGMPLQKFPCQFRPLHSVAGFLLLLAAPGTTALSSLSDQQRQGFLVCTRFVRLTCSHDFALPSRNIMDHVTDSSAFMGPILSMHAT